MNGRFPPPLSELVDEFEELPDWDERYTYLIDLGRQLPPIDPLLQTSEHRVHGCMSTVWMVARTVGNGQPRLEIVADSDSQIVKGLIVVLLSLFSGRPPRDVLTADADEVFDRLGLSQHLSPNRRNGLYSMVKRIRVLAAEQLASQSQTGANS
jgi:cysteine desulfuration protein SufE